MKTGRIEYIDAMRGFTMMLVVYSHVSILGYKTSYPSFNDFFMHFRMPLFFFISGWVLYKIGRIWDWNFYNNFLKKKFVIQIIPTVVFMMIHLYIIDGFCFDSFKETKSGYWFTYTLFEYFILYGSFMYIWNLVFKKESNITDWFVIIFAFSIYLLSTLHMKCKNDTLRPILDVLGLYEWRYFFFFILGTIVKKHYSMFVEKTNNKYVSAILIACLAFMLLFSNKILLLPGGGTIDFLTYGTLGIFVVLTFFRVNEKWFNKDRIIGRGLQYIGRRTLDIYLLHYFFLPVQFTLLGNIFKDYKINAIEFFITTTIALMVIAICLAVSNVIRISPFLAHYLFGVKNNTK